jgi:hypothetical protein
MELYLINWYGVLTDYFCACRLNSVKEYIARSVRESNKPFGGIQLILSGDFFQLPPVPDQNNGVPVPATYAFDAETWELCVGKPVVLSRVFRQKDNGERECFILAF